MRTFISPQTNKVNVKGLIVAGGTLKDQFCSGEVELDARIRGAIIAQVEVNHGGKAGFHEAIARAGGALSNSRILAEKKVLADYMTHMARATGLFVVGTHQSNHLPRLCICIYGP